MNDEGHLTSEERAGYWQGTLAPEPLLAVSDHLRECAACRAEVLAGKPTVVRGADQPVTYEEMVGWMEGDLDPLARRELAERISHSPRASVELVNLMRFRDAMNELPEEEYSPSATREAGRGLRWVLPLAAGLTLGFVFLWLSTTGRERAGQLALLDQGQHLVVRQNGEISPLGKLPGGLQETVRQAIAFGKVGLPPILGELRPTGATLAGVSAPPDSFLVIAPVGTVVESSQPTFRWSAEKGATGYRVNVLPKSGGEVMNGALLPAGQTSWMPNDALKRGEVYEWDVEALHDGELLEKAPAPPQPEARFQVLAESEKAELEQVRHEFGGSHLVLGLAYAKAGLLAQARVELEQLARENPQSELPKKLLASLTAPRN